MHFLGFHQPHDGYGYGTIKIAEHLPSHGITPLDMRDVAAEDGFGVVGDRAWRVDGPACALCTPDWLPFIEAPQLVSYTMHEASRLPAGWVDILNATAGVIVPCCWNVEVFQESGVRVPIGVAKWGVDAADWPLLTRHAERPYTFLWSGTPDLRKGWDVAYRAFSAAFRGRHDVRLVMHFRAALPGNPRFADNNVTVTVGMLDRPGLRQILKDADVFVFPSRGEGWGSPPREAASTGLPVIVTDHGGLAEDVDHWALSIGVAGTSLAEYGYYARGDVGEWVEPDVDELVETMRWCVDNRGQAARCGASAAGWLHKHATWAATAGQVGRLMREWTC